ncbi:respiratory chain complex I subunit 1 family protein [Acidocella sp.]|jgi:formate hydrogenlyase subunit 4|uniref:respiratory chain complex I subunit 1 family protein n=1 Tax=Acidocella sp. TaxID=50710 RepID=UPI002F400859
MLLLLAKLFATLLHIALVFALAPLLAGVVAKLRARLLGRRGPPVVQPYRSLLRLLRKTTLVPETATELYPVWPFAACTAMAGAAMLVPGFSTGMLTAPLGDFITLIGVLALARAATLLGGLESGFGFGGAAAAREVLYAVFAEAALLVVLISFVLIAHAPGIDAIATAFATFHVGISISLGFALVAMLAVALTETGRIPVDNPAGHLEVAMVHEALLLEYSGRFLALFEYAAMLRLLVWMDIIGTVFFPFFMARANDPLTWPVGLALWGAKLAVMAVALPVFEVSMAKMRVFRVPEFLGVAILLGVLAGIFLFVAARIGT